MPRSRRSSIGLAFATATFVCGSLAPLPALASGPSFDCAKAETRGEKLVCADPDLAALDRELADVWKKVMSDIPAAEKPKATNEQRAFLAARDACAGDEATACFRDAYEARIAKLQVQGGLVMVPTPVGLDCGNRENVTVVYYDATKTRIAVLTVDDSRAFLLPQRTGSGTRYVGEGADLREHQGEITIEMKGRKLACRALPRGSGE